MADVAEQGQDVSKMTPAQQKLFDLRMKLNKARKANHTALVNEKKRSVEKPEDVARRKRESFDEAYEKKQKEAKELGIEEDPSLSITLEDADKQEKKKRKKEKNKAAFGWEVFNQDSLYKAYKKRVDRSVKPDLEQYEKAKKTEPEFFRKADSMLYGAAPEAPAEAVDKMVLEIVECADRRNKFSRRREHHPDADVDYINDRNAHFNRKIERAFGSYTKEIKDNLERGTAL